MATSASMLASAALSHSTASPHHSVSRLSGLPFTSSLSPPPPPYSSRPSTTITFLVTSLSATAPIVVDSTTAPVIVAAKKRSKKQSRFQWRGECYLEILQAYKEAVSAGATSIRGRDMWEESSKLSPFLLPRGISL